MLESSFSADVRGAEPRSGLGIRERFRFYDRGTDELRASHGQVRCVREVEDDLGDRGDGRALDAEGDGRRRNAIDGWTCDLDNCINAGECSRQCDHIDGSFP